MNQTMLTLLDGKSDLYPQELEKQFPRILNNIVELWGTPRIDGYIAELMIDSRGGTRQGFPKQVAAELHRLSQAHDLLHQLPGSQVDDPWAHIDINRQHDIERQGYRCTPQDFLKSAEANNRIAVALFLNAGVPVDTRDERGWTPLMISSFNGSEEIAELLIRNGADVHSQDRGGYSPIHWAAYNGYANVIKLLIVRHANVNARNRHGWTPLLQGATRGHLAVCSALIAGGADVNLASDDGWTPLHKACANGHVEVVKLLLSARADRNAQYRDGTTALDLATKNKRDDIIALLAGRQPTIH